MDVIFTPQPLYPEEIAADTLCVGGLVGPRAGLGAVEWKSTACPFRLSSP
jgi:hypothetical protein